MRQFVRELAFILAFMLLVNISASSNMGANDDENIKIWDSAFEEIKNFSFGPISLNQIYNYVVTSEKFQTRRSSLAWVISSEFTGNQDVFSFGVEGEEHMIDCDSLELSHPDVDSDMIDCKPKRKFASDSQQVDDDLSYVEKYVKANVIRFEHQSLGEPVEEQITVLWPIKQDSIESHINNVLEANYLSGLKFLKPHYLGYHFEVTLDNVTLSKLTVFHGDVPIVCSGNIYIYLNHTETSLEGLGIQNLKKTFRTMSNGFVLDIHDMACHIQNFTSFSVKSNLLIVLKQNFPYLTVHHVANFQPIFEEFFHYETHIDQRRSSESPSSYETTTISKSGSSLFRILNFNLAGAHLASSSRAEEDFMFAKPPFLLRLRSVFNEETFWREITLKMLDMKKDITFFTPSYYDLLTEVASIRFEDMDKSIKVFLSVDKDFIKSVLGLPGAINLDEFHNYKSQEKRTVRKVPKNSPQRSEL